MFSFPYALRCGIPWDEPDRLALLVSRHRFSAHSHLSFSRTSLIFMKEVYDYEQNG